MNDTIQGMLAIATATGFKPEPYPKHHPIVCSSELYFYEDGAIGCEHYRMEVGDTRSQQVLNHSLCILLMETAYKEL